MKEIEIKSTNKQSTQIYIGGEEIDNITEFTLHQQAGDIMKLNLKMFPQIEEIKVNGKVEYEYYDLEGNKLVRKQTNENNNI